MLPLLLAFAVAADPAAYPNAKLLVKPVDVVKPAELDKFHLLDARSAEKYAAGHLSLAVRAPVSAWSKAVTGGTGDAAFWGKELAAVGIDAKLPVLVYGGDDMRETCRLWWLLTRAGVPDVRVLDGGYDAYAALGGAVSKEAVAVGKFDPHPWKPLAERQATKDEVLKMLAEKKVTIIDGRSIEEYESGRVPGAKHLEWTDFLDASKSKFKSPDELAKLLKERGVSVENPLCTYCQSGGRASVVAFGLELMGAKSARNYYRSWTEWGPAADTPKEKGKGK